MIEWLHGVTHPFDLDGLVVLALLAWGWVHDRRQHHE